jgi:hypothetical protein
MQFNLFFNFVQLPPTLSLILLAGQVVARIAVVIENAVCRAETTIPLLIVIIERIPENVSIIE